MKKRVPQVAALAAIATILPALGHAQAHDTFHGLQGVLERLYNDMMPRSRGLIDISRGIAGFAALWYIAVRVWGHITRSEPIDFYPLFRPFVLGLCILIFPHVLALINGVLKPTVTATDAMVVNSHQAIERMLTQKQKDIYAAGDPDGDLTPNTDKDKLYKYSPGSPNGQPVINPVTSSGFGFSLKNLIRRWIAEALNLLFQAAALIIDTIRTFKLVVLAILGPIVFGLSVFDGFQHTLKHWLARYINVYLWLPVANIFGAIISNIQENMIRMDLSGSSAEPFFRSTNTAYLIFLMLGIVGYFTVPSIANYIVQVGGHALTSKIGGVASMSTGMIVNQMMMNRDEQFDLNPPKQDQKQPPQSSGGSSGGQSDSYQRNKLSG